MGVVENLVVAALQGQGLEADRFPVQAQVAAEAVKGAILLAVGRAGRPHHGAGEIGRLAAEIAENSESLPGGLARALAEGLAERKVDVLDRVVVRVAPLPLMTPRV